MNSGIHSIVSAYLSGRNIDALSALRKHRMDMLSKCVQSTEYSYEMVRAHCLADLAAINLGINELMKSAGFRGAVDGFSSYRIAGWVQCIDYPNVAVLLQLYFDGEAAVEVLAGNFRGD